ncbi:lipopolysaccharide biosynthesis protein [Carboxylicivirga sp. A043]|uniref:lipopolysaccharide biosynthesis protein n=1 Tax=Carboxylicivirga litoralis TaxID=2816963 RepID=UPI0021CB425C|nr:lipopolysaccharide biosynthesis protein [Carboxylicivirga sp. A043]MCU4157540.1 lipopolysaccharide biosynthesis protein [Carboxylicivirga sp. A043]
MLKQRAVKGVVWSAIQRFSSQGVQFVLGLILARLLAPSDYGLIGMLAIFIAISETFIDSGFSTALVQKKDCDELDYSTSFYFSGAVGFLFYALLFLFAPFIADFYDEPQLVQLTRVVGLTLIVNSLAIVQRAKFTINIDFKSQTKAAVSAITISGGVAIYLAYAGFGVWALVVQNILRRTLDLIILWSISKWMPRHGFSFLRFKGLFSFGSKLLISGLLDTVFKNIFTIVIGKVFSAQSLGFFTRAKQFSEFPSSNITTIIQRVTFPVLSVVQNDDIRLREGYRKIIRLAALVVFPLMMGLAALAKPLVITILTAKWTETVWMLQIMCFAMMWYPIHAINLNVINVKGRSDLFLRVEVIKKVITTIMLVITIPIGIKAMLIGQVATSLLGLSINTYYTQRIINYGFWQQMRDIGPVLLLSLMMGTLVYLTIGMTSSMLWQLTIGTFSGLLFYGGIAWGFNVGNVRLIKDVIFKN